MASAACASSTRQGRTRSRSVVSRNATTCDGSRAAGESQHHFEMAGPVRGGLGRGAGSRLMRSGMSLLAGAAAIDGGMTFVGETGPLAVRWLSAGCPLAVRWLCAGCALVVRWLGGRMLGHPDV